MKKIIFPFLFCVASVCFAETVSDYQIKSDIDKYWAAREQCDRLKSNPIKNFLSVISKPYDCQEADRRLKEIELKGYCLEYGKFRRCGQYEEKDIASLINDYAEQSKQCSDDNSQSFPCVKKKLIAKSLESFGYKLSPDGTWQDAKPENLRFTPISNVKKASDKDLLNQFRLSNENMKYSIQYIDNYNASIGIVTNNFHIFRAKLLARGKGLTNVCGIASPSDEVLFVNYMVREAVGIVKDFVYGNY